MRGDFTRLFTNQDKPFSRLLMQQGRVLLDSDFNEATDILVRSLRTLTEMVIGPHGGELNAFKIMPVADSGGADNNDLSIGPGRYYVQGLLCQSSGDITYFGQYGEDEKLPQGDGIYLAYLDVWERHITPIEDKEIREVALGAPDTATRAQIMWRVRLVLPENWPDDIAVWLEENIASISSATMSARTRPADGETDPCITAPDSRYRGAENQLYRVEIHTGTVDEYGRPTGQRPTFKWSRENGAVVFPIADGPNVSDATSLTTVTFKLEQLGWDDSRFRLSPGDWVEYLNESYAAENLAGPLLQVQAVDRVARTVTTASDEPVTFLTGNYPILRRWDHQDRAGAEAIPVVKGGDKNSKWLELEDHIEICFQSGSADRGFELRSGDYWLIPARTATGDIIWPQSTDRQPSLVPPHGVRHYFAPLAQVKIEDGKVTTVEPDYRHCIKPIATRDGCIPEE